MSARGRGGSCGFPTSAVPSASPCSHRAISSLLCVGLSLPLLISIVTTAAPAHKRGVALGLRDMVNQSAATIAPVVVGPLITALGMALGFTTGGVVGGALLVAARLTHTLDRREQAAGR